MTQHTFNFDPPAQRHSPTSVAAAKSVAPVAPSERERVLEFVRAHPEGVTDEQIADGLGMNPSTQRPRRIELVTAKLVKHAGRSAKTRSGREAAVWEAVR